MKLSGFAFLVAVVLSATAPLWAGPPMRPGPPSPTPAESLEWAIASSDLVVRGIVHDGRAAPFGGELSTGEPRVLILTLEVRETLKGSKRQYVDFLYSPRAWEPLLAKLDGREWLICLGDAGAETISTVASSNSRVPRWYVDFWDRRVFPLQPPWPVANGESYVPPLTIDCQPAESAEQILKIAREECQSESKQRPLMLCIELQATGRAMPAEHELVVPQDVRTERHALQWLLTGSELQRSNALSILGWSRTETDVVRLREMLSDTTSVCIGQGPYRTRFYPVRDYAYGCLLSQDVQVPPPVVEETLCGYHRVGWIVLIASAVFIIAVALRIRSRGAWAKRSHRPWAWIFITILLITVGIGSYWRGGDVVLIALSRHQLSFIRGDFRYAYTRGWPESATIALATFPSSALDEWQWDMSNPVRPDLGAKRQFPSIQYRSPTNAWRKHGFAFAYGEVGAPGSVRRFYFGVRLKLFILAAFAAIVPLQRFSRWIREGSRRRRGLCPACGFDLRASKERCPECGLAIEVARRGFSREPRKEYNEV